MLLVVAGSYMWAYEHGKVVQHRLDSQVLQKYTEQVKTATAEYTEQVKALVANQQSLVDSLRHRMSELAVAKAQAEQRLQQEIAHDVSKRADEAAVRDNVFTAGFVRDYNLSVAPGVPAVSSGPPTDADAPTGLDATAVLSVAASNNIECVARGEVIDQWIDWYTRARAQYDDFVEHLPKPPGVPKL